MQNNGEWEEGKGVDTLFFIYYAGKNKDTGALKG